MLAGLRAVLAHENQPLEQWDSCLGIVTFAINTRILRVHGFTPSQLFMGTSPRGQIENISVRGGVAGAFPTTRFREEIQEFDEVEDWHIWAVRDEHSLVHSGLASATTATYGGMGVAVYLLVDVLCVLPW